MIRVTDKSKCCGCLACVQRCPQQCITMHGDGTGFSYPMVDMDACIDCHLCERVCPYLNTSEPQQPITTQACQATDTTIRNASSSGGVFTLLAQAVLAQGGVVFGARFDEQWQVIHDFTETIEGLSAFRGSKYAQSAIGTSFVQVEQFLKQGRTVLFSGTPCQIAALRWFLRKPYDNLLLADVVCHGVPSPLIWKDYLQSLGIKHIQSLSFRDKSTGWHSYSLLVTGADNTFKQDHSNNVFFKAFLSDLILRPSCFNCPAKGGRSGSDITLGDYWGIERHHPDCDDNHGTSVVICWTAKGQQWLASLQLDATTTSFNQCLSGNPSIDTSANKPNGYDAFWTAYQRQGISVMPQAIAAMTPPLWRRALSKAKRIIFKR